MQNFTIRVSGYAVKFIDLTREQQLDVISQNLPRQNVRCDPWKTIWGMFILWKALALWTARESVM